MALHFKEYGDKSAPLMLFIHGGGVSSWMWEEQIHYFTRFHCIVPDLPEHGLSIQQNEFSIHESAELLIKLIEEKAKGKQVILIGFSLGSQVLIQILSSRPDLIDIAIVNSALTRPFPYAKKFIRPTISLSFPLIKRRWFSKFQAKQLYINEAYFEKYFEESCQLEPETLIRVLEENMSFKIPAGFGKADAKILVTVGENEKSIMKKSAKDIVDANSNCIGIVIPGIGHGVPLAMPDFFNHMIETWVNQGEVPKECR
ncbi:alpha/beta hydrolase [Planococcus sp. N028]|uniref:Alpha/beta hydrolase n=1 Tax=Planococcus shixiaomingii TaxID=3058393 RepID=A0ABT8N0A6_9BACL|nr:MULTISPECIES: alpha/beta hydrolase [unclassified Planococcus (in: firmicutes)]MDN7241326.1 alpha/beta hydrolase [Planococcus sp. N028]WKA56764.1 alpha/beta hydrolase [Planococcus sp. N022]